MAAGIDRDLLPFAAVVVAVVVVVAAAEDVVS